MSFKPFLFVAACACPAYATPTFLPSTYDARILAGPPMGGMSVIMSSTDYTTPLGGFVGPAYATVAYNTSTNDILTLEVSALFPGSTSGNRGAYVSMVFTPSSNATLTVGNSIGFPGSLFASSESWLFEGASLLLNHQHTAGPTASLQVLAGHEYRIQMSASVFASTQGSYAYARLSDPVPAPAGALVLAATGIFVPARRRRA